MKNHICSILVIMMSIASSAYCQNNCFRDSVVGHFREQRIKEVSFDICYSTRDKIQEYGYVFLKGNIKHGSLKLSLEELKETRKSKLRWVRHSFETTLNLENSLIRLVDSLFVTKNIPVIQKMEGRDLIEYGDKNKIRVWIKQRGKNEKYEFFFEDYFQTQVIFDSIVTYSSQMISLLKLLERIMYFCVYEKGEGTTKEFKNGDISVVISGKSHMGLVDKDGNPILTVPWHLM